MTTAARPAESDRPTDRAGSAERVAVHVSGTTHAHDKEHTMSQFVRAAWSLKATPQSKTHLTPAPLSSKAPMVLTYCGILADGASIVYRMSTHLTGRDSNCKRCVAIAEAAPEVHSADMVAADGTTVATELAGLDIDAAVEATLTVSPEAQAVIEKLADELESGRSWFAVRQTGAFAVALDIARQERNSDIRLQQARKAMDTVESDRDDDLRVEAADTFRSRLAAHRNDNNVLWGAARVIATLVDNDDELGALSVLRAELDRQDGVTADRTPRRAGQPVVCENVVPAPPVAAVGMPATFGIGADAYGVVVTSVSPSGHRIGVRHLRDDADPTSFDPETEELVFTRRQDGRYRLVGAKNYSGLSLGEARSYRDPSF